DPQTNHRPSAWSVRWSWRKPSVWKRRELVSAAASPEGVRRRDLGWMGIYTVSSAERCGGGKVRPWSQKPGFQPGQRDHRQKMTFEPARDQPHPPGELEAGFS